MKKGINYAYQELEDSIVQLINQSGLPLFGVRDMINRILLQVDKDYRAQQARERCEYEQALKEEALKEEAKDHAAARRD